MCTHTLKRQKLATLTYSTKVLKHNHKANRMDRSSLSALHPQPIYIFIVQLLQWQSHDGAPNHISSQASHDPTAGLVATCHSLQSTPIRKSAVSKAAQAKKVCLNDTGKCEQEKYTSHTRVQTLAAELLKLAVDPVTHEHGSILVIRSTNMTNTFTPVLAVGIEIALTSDTKEDTTLC